jgi:integrase
MKTFSISFYTRTERVDANDRVPILMRITVDGKRVNIPLNRKVDQKRWKDGSAIGNTQEIRDLRSNMSKAAARVEKIQEKLIGRGDFVSASLLKDLYLGNDNLNKSLFEVMKINNEKMEALVGTEFSKKTIMKYYTTQNHLKKFMLKYYKRDDMMLKELRYSFIVDFETYLKVDNHCAHNTAIKYIKCLKKVINMSLDYEYIDHDPFAKYKIRLEKTEREFLSKEELKSLREKEFSIRRLDQVRDVFVFCCFTGLAFVDVENLKRENIIKGNDDELWLKIFRQKTKSKSQVPLLPASQEILEKYNYLEKDFDETILPVPSNQKMNAYLKEIADICEIRKILTSHMGRHTFATTVTLSNDVPMETVSAMLGHKSIRTTQIYAKVIEDKVSRDMAKLKDII